MRLEHVPVLLGILTALAGLALLGDAWLADAAGVAYERRRRTRTERHRVGEGVLGVGLLCLAAAFIGGPNWRYTTVAMVAGVPLLVAGAVLNRRYLRELLTFRGAARRTSEGTIAPHAGASPEPDRKLRIR